MSIVSLSDGSSSSFTAEDLKELAAELNFEITSNGDLQDYVRLLWSFEAVAKQVETGSDYICPPLRPRPLSTSRRYWKPSRANNPLNAWRHRCDLKAASPISDLLKARTVAIKDSISVAGLPTTLGAAPLLFSQDGEFPLSEIDATVVSRLLDSGAAIKGTSTCECFCASPLSCTAATGPVHNPRLCGYTAGGSSSGSCALVAAHWLASGGGSGSGDAQLGETVELAIGTDQAGSVRIPASYNGLYGLKPTFGLIPYTGAASMVAMIDHLGLIAHRLGDIAALLESVAGYDGLDPRMSPESPLVGQVKPYSRLLADFGRQVVARAPQSGRGWKIGLLTESFDVAGVAAEVRDTVRGSARRFFEAVGATVLEVSIPQHLEGPILWTAATRPSMSRWLYQGRSSGHLQFLPAHLQTRWPLSQPIYEALNSANPALTNILLSERFAERFLPAGIEAKAHRKVFELRDAYDRALEQVDVLITPCAPTLAMPHPGTPHHQANGPSVMDRLNPAIGLTSNTCPFNVTGHPAMNVPCGFASRPERPDIPLPIGMQIIGRRWSDEQVLNAAALFEKGRELAS
ncbi:hypothetical protein VTK73DRAFT_2086 [Phialemonium thermophilum]|uniref:Amidase domain-containing protein n=1 Tax=Phialemonium thermophilum TaxID=223376 RepID=A0ABR3X6Q2_9PEZI